MKRIIFTTVLSFALAASIMAQNKIWSLDDCMRYAVENSPKVKQQLYTNNTYKAEHQSAIASFLPSISTQVDAQYRFGLPPLITVMGYTLLCRFSEVGS